MIRNILAAGALALTMGGLVAATPAAAQFRGDDVVVIQHGERHGDWRRDDYRRGPDWRRDGRWHRPPPPRCRTIIRERETRHGIIRSRERVCGPRYGY